ncbi:MAG: hypothetical protein R2795_26415 [Saprospiraceae bacterium]
MKILSIISLALVVVLVGSFLWSCKTEPKQDASANSGLAFTKPRVPDWHKNATIYEVNLRQYTQEGTFQSSNSTFHV